MNHCWQDIYVQLLCRDENLGRERLGKLTRDIFLSKTSHYANTMSQVKYHTYKNAVIKMRHRCRRLAPRNTMFRNKCISVLTR